MNPNTEKDIKKSKVRHTVDSLFVENVTDQLLRYSFYLPVDVITSPHVTVEPIKQMSNMEFNAWIDVSDDWINFDGDARLVLAARTIAVSTRHTNIGTVHVCKVWYGNGVTV